MAKITNIFKNKKKNIKLSRIHTTLSEKTPWGVAEAYRYLRTNLIYSIAASQKKVILVSSAGPGEGKSTTSANIAISLAQASSKVILIDADMRKPTQHKIFGINNKAGLSNIVCGFNTTEEVVHCNVRENLDIITAGVLPPNPAELIQSDMMKSLIKVLSNFYDYIIIDTPPINIITDAILIANENTGIALVCRQKQTTYDELENAINKIKMTKASFMGVIINYVRYEEKIKSNYKYKNYEYEYGKK